MDLVYQLVTSNTKAAGSQTVPQWKLDLAKLPALTTQQAACAFADVDYYKLEFIPDPSDEELEADKARADNLRRWLRIIEQAASYHELPAENIRNGSGDECDIWMFSQEDFAAWCHSKGVLCPIPMKASVSVPAMNIELDAELKNATSYVAKITETKNNSLTFGNHETDLLRKMARATDRFWSRYDPSDISTAPTNKQVIDWLTKEGVALRTAEVIASILRVDGLPTGPRK